MFTQIVVTAHFASVEYLFLKVLFVASIANDVSKVRLAFRFFVVRVHLVLIRTIKVDSVFDEWVAIFSFILFYLRFFLEASSTNVLVTFPVAPVEAAHFFVDAFLPADVTGDTAAERMEQVVHQVVVVLAFGRALLLLFWSRVFGVKWF